MSNFDLSKLMNESATAQETLLKQTRGLVKKWAPTGLLEGISKEHEKHGMAVLLENQARELITEDTKTTISSAGEQWAGVALPLVRKIFGEIAAKEFVSVQPMNLPSGLVFYMDFQYGNTRGIRNAGDSVYGITSGAASLPSGGLYGSGKFGYSINTQTASVAITNVSAGTFAATSQSVLFQNVDPTTLTVYAVPVSGNFTNPDLFAVRAWTVSGSVGNSMLPEYTFVSSSAGVQNVYFVANTTPSGSAIGQVIYTVQPIDSNRGDFEDRVGTSIFTANPQGVDLQIPEIDLQLRSEPIVAKTRKLKAVWTPELAQDLNAYHSIDAEAELTAMLSEYISLEIDLEILDMLTLNAQTVDYWSTTIGTTWNGTAFTAASFTGTAWTNMTWYQTLGQKIQKVSNIIHQLTMRGGANFLVVSPQVATILESIPGFSVDTNGEKSKFAMGVTQIGSFQSRFTVYKNPYLTTNVVLMGYKGSNFLETGAVYAPYVPLVMTPLVYDPENFTPRRGVLTRYAKKMIRPEFFGKIIIQGLNNI